MESRCGYANRSVWILACLTFGVASASGQDWAARREKMVSRYIVGEGIQNSRVIQALRKTPRHAFVPERVRGSAYFDGALPIGYEQTISSPYIVARMSEQLDLRPGDKVLEIGTGSGYQAAILSQLAREVFTIEIVPELGNRARQVLERLGYANVRVRVGDGYQGWPQHAPFDKIIVTCSPEEIPQPLVEQLAEGGHLVVPLGERFQQVLYRFTKRQGKLQKQRVETTFFVPMTGRADREREPAVGEPLTIRNGSFERTLEQKGELDSWYYVRGGESVVDVTSPDGKRCLQLNTGQSVACHALQPFGVDGRTHAEIRVSLWSRARHVQAGLLAIQTSQLVVEFYDGNRSRVGEAAVPLQPGTHAWTKVLDVIKVPREARFAILGVGLFGGSGEISFDQVRVESGTRRDN